MKIEASLESVEKRGDATLPLRSATTRLLYVYVCTCATTGAEYLLYTNRILTGA